MVTFSCDNCNDTVKKPKANQHAQRCRGSLTCIDCSKTFWSGEWNAHNACISEAEAYQGALYKPTKKELKRKAAEAAVQQAKTVNGGSAPPSSHVVASTAQELSTSKDTATEDSSARKKVKREKREHGKDEERPNIALLKSILPQGSQISLYKVLKTLKAQKKLDKDGEKAFLKEINLMLDPDGALRVV